MPRYGYRLFCIEVHQGHKRAPIDFSECSDKHYRSLVKQLLVNLRQNRWGKPKLRGSDEEKGTAPGSGDPAFRVIKTGESGWVIAGSFYSGKFGDYPLALGSAIDDEDTDLSDQAPAREFRFVMCLPEKGKAGFLGVELIGQQCPVALLTSWLSLQSKDEAEAFNLKKSDADKEQEWWYLKAFQMTDVEHLRQIIRQGSLAKVELVQHILLPDRSRRRTNLQVTVPYLTGERAKQVADLMVSWFNRNKREVQVAETSAQQQQGRVTNSEGASELSAAIGSEVEHMEFDDGWVVIDDGSGRTKKISPDRMSELFSYTLNWDVAPTDAVFYERVSTKAKSLQSSAKISLTWPPLSERPRLQ